ncbi:MULTISPECIES: quinone-dependent dihydroorotate dehydrogenase [Citromicrobium]|uniref:quinone-dependent dihydroorotate dehydrogenase n=1 Tax=Citromicrobium TaxID=72173 RepID=UPI0001DD099B|nr:MULTISPECIES: quinone-dependent dihydroorotate dehydrogenase [Citromicrobium]ALG59963.1 dihydroorotate dehydrogenase [Citromicrobium sp. JL477]KPM16549.1 dihydroorotate dehydrogenase [Citromicrobium sp. JL31]KPM18577.1 dihydroorotate dehydrogenase [Citromicrobium sp. JL1351]KPM30105.1 dihydroorotate dehydrogenase [Citromicrobium sp. JL2201]
MLFPLARPLLFTLDPERAHRLSLAGLKRVPTGHPPRHDPALGVTIGGVTFPSPVGVAPGYDKDAEVPDALLGLGFGFVEVGTITPLPQAGNPKPRLFRLAEDRAVINRMGFNNGGAEAAHRRLRKRAGRPGIVGINIGANKDSDDRIADYALMTELMAPLASYLTINISSPNTPGLRDLQTGDALKHLLDGVFEARGERATPVFLKLAPDLEPSEIDAIAKVALDSPLAALIISNTTLARPDLKSSHADEAGGLSGAPLAPLALQRLKDFRKATGGQIPLIAAGGIDSADAAWERIVAGASLVQLYSAMVYHGPMLGRRIAKGLSQRLRAEGFASIEDAIGSQA